MERHTIEPGLLYAFWEYDLYPFCMGGVVTALNEKGWVEAEAYGKHRYFNPIVILPVSEGKKIAAELEKLGNEYRKESKFLLDEFKKKAKKAAHFL